MIHQQVSSIACRIRQTFRQIQTLPKRGTSSATTFLVTAWMCTVATAPISAAEQTTNWPSFRGVKGTGFASGFQAPLKWDLTNSDDPAIAWRTDVPGLGHSSPVIFGNRLFLTTAIAAEGESTLQIGRSGSTDAADDHGQQTWAVLCYDKSTGQQLWRQDSHTGHPKATRHTKATHANASVAVNADRVVAFFGSEGLYCYDHDGQLLWKKDFGVIDISKYDIGWGYASSPAIHNDRIVLVCDAPDDPFVIALDIETGDEVWRKSRQGDSERSWGTALIHQTDTATQVVVNGWPWVVSYDLETGEEIWRIEGGGDNPTPTPFAIDGRIYITSSHGGKSPIIVVKEDATGNLTDDAKQAKEHLLWRTDRGGSYMSTPVVADNFLHLGNTNGVLRSFHAVTGEKAYEKRIGRGVSIFASLVAADGKVYCPAEDGTIYVVRSGPDFEVLAKNPMGEPCFATPAISEGQLFVRTTKSLIAIGEKEIASKSTVGGDHQEERPKAKAAPTEPTETSATKKNVLFIAVDDLRPSLGCYGDSVAISPNIDALADRGLQFDRAYCQVAVCNPSRASLMTGLRPDKLGVWTLPIHFREAMPDAITMPQWFRKFGYTAISHGKIYHNPTPDPQSWSEPIHDLPPLPDTYPKGTRSVVQAAMKDLPANDWRKKSLRRPSTAAPELPDSKIMDGAQTDLAIKNLRRLGKQSQPFFLAMGYIRPHLSFVAPKKYWDLYDPDALPVPTDQQVIANTPPYAPPNNSELSHYVDLIDMPKPWDDDELPEETRRRLMHGYYACVSYVDAQIGRLINALETEGLTESTTIVLWSDHGWKLGDNRSWGKMTNYEIDARVPLIIASPGMKNAGQKTNELVELLDLYPTLCELSQIDTPEFIDGKSLVPMMNDPSKKLHDEAISQYYRRFNKREYMGYSMRTDRYRFIEWRDFGSGEVTARELYDHDNIAFKNGLAIEKVNLIDSAPKELVDRLTKQLAASHPAKKLVMKPKIHSSQNGDPAKLTLSNQSKSELRAYLISSKGRRGKAKRIAVNKDATLQGNLGSVYVIESKDGMIHQIHSPSLPPKVVEIGQPE